MAQALRRGCAAGDSVRVAGARAAQSARRRHRNRGSATIAFDTATPIVKGTWRAALAAANMALTAAEAVRSGERAAFALARPPGHHASADVFGGYCYLNNIAIAAQWLARSWAEARDPRRRLSSRQRHAEHVLSPRRRVLRLDPRRSERSPIRISWVSRTSAAKARAKAPTSTCRSPCIRIGSAMQKALDAARCSRIKAFAPDVLLVSLGLDTFEADPISKFRLGSEDYLRMGEDHRRREAADALRLRRRLQPRRARRDHRQCAGRISRAVERVEACDQAAATAILTLIARPE